MQIRTPYIYAFNSIRVSDTEQYEGHDCSYCSIGKLYNSAQTLPGIPSIWGFNDEEYFYSGDLGCGYLFDLVGSVEIGSERLIFTSIHSDSTVGPISIYETFLSSATFQIPTQTVRIIDFNTRLNSPFILESNDSKFLWVVSSDLLGASSDNVFKYYSNAGVYTDAFSVNTGSRVYGENVDDKVVLLSCNQNTNKLKVELRNNSDFSVASTQTLSSSGIFTTDIKRTFYKESSCSNWIIHIVDDLYATTWKLPQLVEITSAGVSTVSTLTTGGGIKEVLDIQEIDGNYYGVYQENNVMHLSKNSTVSGLFTSPTDEFEIALSGAPSWNQAFYKKYNSNLFLMTTREDEDLFQLFRIDFNNPEPTSNAYDLENSTFMNFFTSACPSSGNIDKIQIGLDDIQVVRTLQKDSNDISNLSTFSVASKKNTTMIPSSSLFYPDLSRTKGKNLFTHEIASNIGNLQDTAFSKMTLNFIQTYIEKIKDRINETLNFRIENYSPNVTGSLSIASKKESDYLWICLNLSDVIFIAKKLRTDFHGISKYYNYKNSEIISLSGDFVAIGLGTRPRIIYNKLTDQIILTYSTNDVCISRSWDFDEDPQSYFIFRKKEPQLMDLSSIDRISSSIEGNISPCPANMSDSKFHLSRTSTRHFNVEDIKELYENFNISYQIDIHPTVYGDQIRYRFHREIDILNHRENMIRFIKFEYYYKINEVKQEMLIDPKEIYRPAGPADPGLMYFKKVFSDPAKNEVKVINSADPAEDVCLFSFTIISAGEVAPYANKELYIKPFFGIFSDNNLSGMVDIIEGTIVKTGIILGTKSDKELTGYTKGVHSTVNAGTISSYNSRGVNHSIDQEINNSYNTFNLPLILTNLGKNPKDEININFKAMKSSINYRIISYKVKTVF